MAKEIQVSNRKNSIFTPDVMDDIHIKAQLEDTDERHGSHEKNSSLG